MAFPVNVHAETGLNLPVTSGINYVFLVVDLDADSVTIEIKSSDSAPMVGTGGTLRLGTIDTAEDESTPMNRGYDLTLDSITGGVTDNQAVDTLAGDNLDIQNGELTADFSDHVVNQRMFSLSNNGTEQWFKIGRVDNGGNFNDSHFGFDLQFAGPISAPPTGLRGYFANRDDDPHLEFESYGSEKNRHAEVVITSPSSTNEHYLYIKATSYLNARLVIWHSPNKFGSFDYQVGLTQSDTTGEIVYDTETMTPNAVKEIGDLHIEDAHLEYDSSTTPSEFRLVTRSGTTIATFPMDGETLPSFTGQTVRTLGDGEQQAVVVISDTKPSNLDGQTLWADSSEVEQ
ncbi:hypothetical protein ACFFQF_00960 [Haladaptatus pallidirubidus]